MSDDTIADDIVDMLGPDATQEQRLAARLILIGRDQIDLASEVRRDLAETRTAVAAAQAEIKALRQRPTLAGVLTKFAGSKAGSILVIGLVYAVLNLTGVSIAYVSGVLDVDMPTGIVAPPTVAP